VVRSYNKNGVKSEENKGSHPLAVNTAKIGGIYTLTYPRCLGLFKQKDHSCVVFAVAQRRKAVPRRAKFFGVKLDQATYIGTAEVFADLPQSSDAFQWVEQLMKLRNSFGGILGWDFAEELMRASEKPFRGLVATGDKGVFCSRMVEEAIRVTLAADPEFGERNKIAGKMKKFCAVFGCDVNVEIPVSQTPQFSRKYRGAIGLGWWMKLISEWKTSERSELRRRSTLDEIKNPETRRAYDQLWQEYNDAAVEDFGGIGLTEAQTDNITTLALALAHVKEHVKGESFFTTANRFGIRVGVDGRIKFHQVFEVIRRAGYRINVGSLSQELYFWNSKSRG